MADHEEPGAKGLFGGVFARGDADTSDGAWLQAMLDAEAGLARAVERAGLAPAGSGEAVTAVARAANFQISELGELAALTGNPVPALARALARRVPQTAAGAVHRGATSQDIVDTAAMLLARRAVNMILADLARGAEAAAGLARTHQSTIMIGRTVLQQAVPVTFGLVAAGWLTGLDEAREGLAEIGTRRLAVQFGGAAGTLASLGEDGPRVVALLAEELGLALPVLPWHTDRLRVIDLATALARVTAALGKIARDVTLLAQSEVGEVSEGSSEVAAGGPQGKRGGPGAPDPAGPVSGPRRGGSSAMPHKHNPVAAIAILGCTRQAPGLLATLVACAEQEHQRAAGAWHAEWEPLTALLRITGSAASWAAELLSGLTVDASRMAANLAATKDLPLAEHVTSLLAGVLGGVQARDLVAEAGRRALSAGLPLRDVLLAVPKLESRLAAAGITAEQIESALEPAGYLGAAEAFTAAALEAHEALEARQSQQAYPSQDGSEGRPGPGVLAYGHARPQLSVRHANICTYGGRSGGIVLVSGQDGSEVAEIVSLAEAVEQAIHDGDAVAMEGFTHLIPFAAGHEVIRQRRRDLTLIRMTPDLIYDQLIGAGCARKLIFSWGGNPGVGSLHRFRDAVEHAWPAPLEIEEHSHAGMANRYVAGASGLPFAVLRGYNGTGLYRQGTLPASHDAAPTIKPITCPFTGETLTAVAALRPDVAVIHAQRADRSGNVQFWGIAGVQKEAVLSSHRSVVTVEEVVDRLDPRPGEVVLPSWTVSYVAHVPGGAHPSYTLGYTVRDNDYYVAWDTISRDRDAFTRWLHEQVYPVPAGPL